jgi:iron complex transport system ATP-binding protein
VIRAENLAVKLGGNRAVDGVSLDVERDEFVGVVGPNGAGKTTLLRALAGRLDPAAGSVSLGEDPVSDLGATETARRVAVLPQDSSLTFEFSVRDAVAMGRNPHIPRFGADPNPGAVDDAMERVDVDRFADRPVTAVSGGERQRVLLARALAQDAPALLLDEPTASLDVRHAVRTLRLAADLARDGRAVAAAVHDLDLAARFCDRLLLLADGAPVAAGPPEAVLTADNVAAAFGADAAVARDPVTGAPHVAALPERERRGAGRVHVAGVDASLLSPLTAAGFDVSVGVVPEGSQAAAAAAALGIESVSAPPFEPVDAAEREEAIGLARGADVTVLTGDLGGGAVANLDAAAAADRLVVVEDESPDADPEVTDRYESLRDRARVADDDPDAVVDAAAALAERPAARRA